jgi:drug/metabolite transporter (DMT)-like permease
MLPGRERTTLAIFIVMSVLAGGNAVGVRFSNRELDPLWGATVRFALAAALALAVMVMMRQGVPRGRALLGAVLYGFFSFGGAFALAYYGLVRVQAGIGQTLLALVPLATLLLAVIQRQERLHMWAVGGTVLALAGVAVVSGIGGGGSVPALSLLALVGASLCFGEAAVIVRRFPPVHPVVMNAVGMTAGAIFLFAGSLVAQEDLAMPTLAATWVAILYLVAIGSVLVFALYVIVLRQWAASRASYTFVLVPIVTVLLSAWLDDEEIGPGLVFGGLLVLAGVYIGALRPVHAAVPGGAIPPTDGGAET